SYGVEVAARAGIPGPVIARAREVLRDLEAGAPVRAGRARRTRAPDDERQLSLADLGAQEIAARLRRLDVNTLTPLEALTLLHELCQKARG
ncbi:MAG: DNA mismatch repair protein MutS, partial [Oscillospiraceae bacterium]|nr:DNA mismatch repair protein MutS [Oscillospiraceae bacterium]